MGSEPGTVDAGSPAMPPGAGQPTRTMFELARRECLQLLSSGGLGRVAINMGGNRPVIRPVNYVFDRRSQSVVFRTTHGSKLHALLVAGEAVFEVDDIDVPERTGWSVIVAGVAEEVTDRSEIRRLETLGLDVWAPGHRTRWVRIRAWTVSGRRIVSVAH